MRNLPALALLVIVFVCPYARGQSDSSDSDSPDGPTNLQPQWSQGQSARYQFWTKRKRHIRVRFSGKSRAVDSTMVTKGEITWTVEEVESDGSSTCTMVMDWITTDITAQGKTQSNDSRKAQGQTPPLHALLQAMAGVPITCHVDAQGTIQSIDGQSKIKTKLPKKLQGIAPDKRELVESASELATLAHAPSDIEVGEDYQADYQWSHQMGTMNQHWTYTLESVQPMAGIPVATVNGQADLDLDVDRSDMPDNAPPVDVQLQDASANSQVLFDLDRHEAVGRNQIEKQTIEINLTLPQGKGQLHRQIDQTVQSQVLRLSEG